MKTKLFLALLLTVALTALVGTVPAKANTVWFQQWDTTPVNPPATIDEIIIYADTNTGLEFGDALTSFVPYGVSSAVVTAWISTLVNPWEVVASGPAVSGQDFAFNINFGTPLATPGYLMFEYFDNGQLVTGTASGPNPQQWYYAGTGDGNNPVSSWNGNSDPNFGAVPEPATFGLIGLGLFGLGIRIRARKTR